MTTTIQPINRPIADLNFPGNKLLRTRILHFLREMHNLSHPLHDDKPRTPIVDADSLCLYTRHQLNFANDSAGNRGPRIGHKGLDSIEAALAEIGRKLAQEAPTEWDEFLKEFSDLDFGPSRSDKSMRMRLIRGCWNAQPRIHREDLSSKSDLELRALHQVGVEIVCRLRQVFSKLEHFHG